jgi:hypothetical protein
MPAPARDEACPLLGGTLAYLNATVCGNIREFEIE